jgi:1-deoxy-D-xylulose-5-phosphate reductoisomerase
MHRLAILGSTGSVGRSVLEVVRHHPERLRVAALAAWGSELDLLQEQIEEFQPSLVAVHDAQRSQELRLRRPGLEVVAGDEGLVAAVEAVEVDRVVGAIVGAAGLRPVYAALEAGKDVALANKESLVAAGGLLKRVARRSGAEILPIDSEHVALHQALRSGTKGEVESLVLTASGGPFRERDLDTWESIHPTWEMGAKISIDSATLMNKGLELIEAAVLFGLPSEKVSVVIHPQSVIHSLVEYRDGSWLAQLSVNDMVFPIQYALSFPDRWPNRFKRLDLGEIGRLDFEELDRRRFPSVDLAREALARGESGPAVMNAANEVAVHAFLDGRLPFIGIVPLAEEVLRRHDPWPVDSLEAALEADRWGRENAAEMLPG